MWLWALASASKSCVLRGRETAVAVGDLSSASALCGRLEELRGRSVLLATRDQLPTALALIELDGVARRIVVCPPDVAPTYLPSVIVDADVDALVVERESPETKGIAPELPTVVMRSEPASESLQRRQSDNSEWVLLSSGTTGAPKLVLHTCASLTSALTRTPLRSDSAVWSTFYDIRRYGGLQIFLRALGSAALVLSSPQEPVAQFLTRVAAAGVTHISGTPTHWRRALMSGLAGTIEPGYVRLSGEIADQGILDRLRAAYPEAVIEHAFASTEAGVGFVVTDGLAGFPAGLLSEAGREPELRVTDDTLEIRGPGNASRYLGGANAELRTSEGFVDTGDRVQLRDGRYYFVGRAGGVINVGGMKVYPEEVEAVINSHPKVRMSLVKARHSPITGAIVSADVVPTDDALLGDKSHTAVLSDEIRELCQRHLAPYKIPVTFRFVASLETSGSGKLVRSSA